MSTAEAITAAPDYLAEFQIFLWLTGVLLIVLPFLTGAADVATIAKTIKRPEKHAGVWHQCATGRSREMALVTCDFEEGLLLHKYPELVGLKTKVMVSYPSNRLRGKGYMCGACDVVCILYSGRCATCV